VKVVPVLNLAKSMLPSKMQTAVNQPALWPIH